jgi:oligoendopeptidase F
MKKKLIGLINSNPDLKIYKHSFDDLFRFRKHTLEREQEELLAMASEVTQVPYNTYSLFTNADLKFPKVKMMKAMKLKCLIQDFMQHFIQKIDRIVNEHLRLI